MAPEKIRISDEWLSEYSNYLKIKFNIGKSKVRKIVLTLMKKQNYVLHYKNLEHYTQLGMKVSKYHRILTFDESPWLKSILTLILKRDLKQRPLLKKTF